MEFKEEPVDDHYEIGSEIGRCVRTLLIEFCGSRQRVLFFANVNVQQVVIDWF